MGCLQEGNRLILSSRLSFRSFRLCADDRNQPFDFTLGAGNVIKGWDLGVAGMCPGEVRKLKVSCASLTNQ